MSDVDEDDESQPSAEVVQRIEVDMLNALENDFEECFGDPVTVVTYLAVAEVIKVDGSMDTYWTAPESMTPQAMLGLAHWLLKRVDEAT